MYVYLCVYVFLPQCKPVCQVGGAAVVSSPWEVWGDAQ